MIVEKDANLKIEQTSPFKRKAFGIASTAEAFRILSKGIYSDPITAVIRELGTNANDGHKFAAIGDVEAGITPRPGQDLVPFDVFLPTRLDPTFCVRDYGIGLSEEQIFEIYTTYFESNKRESNDFNGTLGLGSKSPFAIVSSFMVTAFYKGKKTVYSAIVGEDGCPDIVKMTEVDSDESQGMEIKLTVTPDDIWNFEYRAKQVYQYFDVKPNLFQGKTKVEIPETNYDYKTNDFGVIKNSSSTCLAIQSNVAYSLDTAPLIGKITESRLALLKQYAESFHLFFNNGEVNFVASREHLEYTPRTIAAIDKKIDSIVETVRVEFDEIRNSAETFIEAIHIIQDKLVRGFGSTVSKMSMTALAADTMQKDGCIKWNNTPITAEMFNGVDVVTSQTFSPNDVNLENGLVIPKYGYSLPFTIFNKEGGKETKYKAKYEDCVRKGKNYIRNVTYMMPIGSTLFILNDDKLAQYKVVEYITKHNKCENVYLFHPDLAPLMKQMMKASGVKTVTKTSDIDVSDVERRQLIKTCRMFKVSTGAIVDKTLDDLSEIKYYMVAKGSAYTFHMFDNVYSYAGGTRLIKDLAANNVLEATDTILVLPASSAERLLALFPHLVPVAEVLNKLEWKTLPEKTRITLMKSYIKKASKDAAHNFDYKEVTVHLERAAPKTKSLQDYISTVQSVVKKVRAQLDKMNEYQYRYSQVEEEFTSLISKRLVKDPEFIAESADLKEFIEVDNQARKVFPILGLTYVQNIKAEDLTRYVESDWEANQHEV